MAKKLARIIGPGIITGAADNDPSGIATYSQTGAQFGYGQLWTALFLLPLQTAVQEACARIGAVTGKGIGRAVKSRYGMKFACFIVSLLFLANTINIAADIGAMAAAARLILPINFVLLTIFFTVLMVSLEVLIPYKRYANFLKWLSLSLLAYPITLLIVKVSWLTLLKATFIPHIELNYHFLFIMTGVFGTTISPYLFFWQTAQVIEELKQAKIHRHHRPPKLPRRFVRHLRIDNFFGMLFSQICAWSIIAVAASTLHANHITDIQTAADAARALEPLVGNFAKIVFALGIIGLGLLSIPVLAGSSAYALGGIFNWTIGLNLKYKSAHKFYNTIILSTSVGLLINFVGIDPIKALVYAAVINGIVAVPLLFIIAIISSDENTMGAYRSRKLSQTLLWITFFCMLIATIALSFAFLKKP